MKSPVVARAAISLVPASTTVTNALAGKPAVVRCRAAAAVDVERWTATRCRGAALAAL
ncbi:hypothetical protein [Sorangium sp. So ce1335]|uniref:hypothetical protein n=1 Tax=Sorangium sp. So ce1335 TaxID=3133335 RepID=UPI003F6154E1